MSCNFVLLVATTGECLTTSIVKQKKAPPQFGSRGGAIVLMFHIKTNVNLMKNLQIIKMVSVFSRRSMLACMIAVSILFLISCGKHSMEGIDLSSIEPSRPAVLNKVPASVISDMQVFTAMNLNTRGRIELYLKEMTPQKIETINIFKDVFVFSHLSKDEQIKVISEVLGFHNTTDYIKYAEFMEVKKQNLTDYVKKNHVKLNQLSNELMAVNNIVLSSEKSARMSSYEEIPDEWIDIDAYVGGSEACKEYSNCVTNKMAEGIAGSTGAALVAAALASPTGPGAVVAGLTTFGIGISGAAFATIYAATFGDCRLKREQYKRNERPYGEINPYDSENLNPNLGTGRERPGGYTPIPR